MLVLIVLLLSVASLVKFLYLTKYSLFFKTSSLSSAMFVQISFGMFNLALVLFPSHCQFFCLNVQNGLKSGKRNKGKD